MGRLPEAIRKNGPAIVLTVLHPPMKKGGHWKTAKLHGFILIKQAIF
jgi:hypothetical protein